MKLFGCIALLLAAWVAFVFAQNYDDAAVIQDWVDKLQPSGGIVQLPCGWVKFSGLVLGNGSDTQRSFRNSITIRGCGGGRSDDLAYPTDAGTQLVYTGPPGGTMIKVRGPIGNVVLEDFDLYGAGIAGVGLDVIHSYNSAYKRMNIWHWTQVGVRSQAVDFPFPGMVNGNNGNVFEQIHSWSSVGSAESVAGQFGQAAPNTRSIFDFASNTLSSSSFRHDMGVGLELRYADNNTFLNVGMASARGAALKLTPVGSPGEQFPYANSFYQCAIGKMSIPDSFSPSHPNFFLPLSDTDVPMTGHPGITGFNSSGRWFGSLANR